MISKYVWMSNINLKKFVHSYLRKTIIKDINLSYKKKKYSQTPIKLINYETLSF